MTIVELLARHRVALEAICDAQSRAAWHSQFACDWVANAQNLAYEANARYGLHGATQIRDEVGYLCVETQPPYGSDTWILLSANPGWSEELNNSHERRLKGQGRAGEPFDVQAYEAFRSAFLPRWYDEVVEAHGNRRRGAWWNKALLFMHAIAGLAKPGYCRVNPDLNVLGWELWPFHSSKDGLSKVVDRHRELATFRTASILAAARTPSRGVIAASAAAYRFFQQATHDFTLSHPPECVDHRIKLASYEPKRGGAPIHVINWQIFSSNARLSSDTHTRLVELIMQRS